MNEIYSHDSVMFIVTMDMAVELLNSMIISPDEYKEFLDKMTKKYNQDYLQSLYQIKLDIFLDKRVNTNTKGEI